MSFGQKIIPTAVNVDLHESLMTPDLARYIKNLVYSLGDSSDATITQGGQSGAYKPLQANARYVEDLVLPEGYNLVIGKLSSKETKEVLVAVYNDRGNHTLYKLNGTDQTFNIIDQGPIWNFQPHPEYFIHEGGGTLKVIYLTNPDTGQKIRRSYWMFTDGYNPQRFICLEDAIATSGYDANLFGYFGGNYDPQIFFNMGVPTPDDCISITEVPVTEGSESLNNTLLFKPWQFRLRHIDVWGRMSEYGIISDLYIPGINDCISASSAISRCLDLIFDAPSPNINQVEIAYRNCNDQQWYTSKVLDLYGSPINDWWLRQRNPDVNFNAQTNKITYRFCADAECKIIAPTETNRLYNPLPRTSQSLAEIGKFIGVGNNKDGFLPFSKELKDKIKITVEAPVTQNENQNNFRNLSIWAEIYNPALLANQPIFYDGADGEFKTYVFGAFNTSIQYRSTFAYKQYFPNILQKGFVGYLAGTNYYVISKQFFLSDTGTLTEIVDFSINSLKQYYTGFGGIGNPAPKLKGIFLQKFEFSNVPRGNYIFRIAGHQSNPTVDRDYQSTSTYFKGLYGFNSLTFANPIDHSATVSDARELKVNACDADYDGYKDSKIPVIFDLNYSNSDVNQVYVKNTNVTGEAQYGIELLKITGDVKYGVPSTDHNGYFFTSTNNNNLNNDIWGYCNCALTKLFKTISSGTHSNDAHPPIFLYLNQTDFCTNYETQSCNQILIKGKITLCGSNIGVPGVVVLLSRGQMANTNDNGEFTIIAHDDTLNINRNDEVFFIPGSCSFDDCDGNCILPYSVIITKCVACTERIIDIGTTFFLFKNSRGLLSGVTYPIGVVGWDWLKRPTFVQSLGTMNIPSVQDIKLFAPSKIKVDIDGTAVFPVETTSITFWVGSPADIADYITWIVDRVEFIDNTGSVNNAAPTQIKIFYASLIEYNKQNNFNTTVNWQFLVENTTNAVTSDKVQFLLNGDGTFFNKSIISLVKYSKDGQYFLINYTTDLKDLKENAIIRLIRPKICDTTELYYEVCSTIKIVDRKASILSFYLNAFDTYYVNRQIPVPITVEDDTVNQLRIFGVPFEHNSPSDFWGQGCKNIGRGSIENPQESEIYHEEQVALSGALSETGLLNFLNYYEDSDTKKINFDDINLNGIVAMLPQTSIVLIIGQSEHFIVGYGDNIARATEDGLVQVASTTGFGRPQRKLEDNYGCLLRDKNTISVYEGKIAWLDTYKSSVIHHNYQDAIVLSKNGTDSYIRPKVKFVANYNLSNSNKRYFIGIINPISFEYLLSDFIFGEDNYINNERGIEISKCETISYDLTGKFCKGWLSYCPEYYASLEGERNNSQLFTFKNGIPYYHYNALASLGFNTFYGTKVSRVLDVVMVLDRLKKKKALSFGVYCPQCVYYADQIVTEGNQLSHTLKDYFVQAEYFWSAPFLCDLNTPLDTNIPEQTGTNKLLDGDVLYGTWIRVRLIGDPDFDDKYSELQGIIGFVFPSEKSGTQ